MVRGNLPEFNALGGRVISLFLATLLIAASLAFAQPSGTIGEIEIVGNLRVETQAIRGHISSKVGEPLNEAVVDQDIKAIYKMGFFSQVNAEVTHRAGELVLIFRLKELPYITDVKLEGLKAIKSTDEKIQESLKLHPGAILDPELAHATEKAIEKVYQDKGYMDVSVTFRTDPGPITARSRFSWSRKDRWWRSVKLNSPATRCFPRASSGRRWKPSPTTS